MKEENSLSKSERKLVERAISGSERAFRRIVENHTPVVYSVVRAILGNHPMVEDVVQEVFILVYTKLDTFRGDSKLSSWIYRIARNKTLDALHEVNNLSYSDLNNYDIAYQGYSPAREYEIERLRVYLDQLISGLPYNHRMVIELRYLADKSYSEIADIMNIPVGTVKTYLFRAKKSLARKANRTKSRSV